MRKKGIYLILITILIDLLNSQNHLPDFISVTVPDRHDPETSKCIIVEIVNIPIVKPFLGGFINNLTGEIWSCFSLSLYEIQIEFLQIGTVYHNAYTQTGPIKEQIKYSGLVTRDTQTSGLKVYILEKN